MTLRDSFVNSAGRDSLPIAYVPKACSTMAWDPGCKAWCPGNRQTFFGGGACVCTMVCTMLGPIYGGYTSGTQSHDEDCLTLWSCRNRLPMVEAFHSPSSAIHALTRVANLRASAMDASLRSDLGVATQSLSPPTTEASAVAPSACFTCVRTCVQAGSILSMLVTRHHAVRARAMHCDGVTICGGAGVFGDYMHCAMRTPLTRLFAQPHEIWHPF